MHMCDFMDARLRLWLFPLFMLNGPSSPAAFLKICILLYIQNDDDDTNNNNNCNKDFSVSELYGVVFVIALRNQRAWDLNNNSHAKEGGVSSSISTLRTMLLVAGSCSPRIATSGLCGRAGCMRARPADGDELGTKWTGTAFIPRVLKMTAESVRSRGKVS